MDNQPGYFRPLTLDHDPSDYVRLPLYRQLSAASQEVRLLIILPTQDPSSTICCQLRYVSLDQSPEEEPLAYESLSYCWGDAAVTVPIWLNNIDVLVTTNLEAALRQLRSDGHHTLWVDALCINQKDLDERARQVGLMKYIYKEAAKVIVWVGLQDDESNRAQDFMEQVGRQPSEMEAFRKDREETVATGRFHASWKTCGRFFARPYWSRIWIIQEIAVGAKIFVQCGQRVTPWPDIRRLLPYYQDLVDFEEYRRMSRNSFHLKTLLQVLYDTRNSSATDPKDKIYALLGLTNDGPIIVGLPRYNVAAEIMLKQVTANIFLKERNLNFIGLRKSQTAIATKLPSWMPDLTDLANTLLPWQADYFTSSQPLDYTSSISTIPRRPSENFEIIGDELQVTGTCIDTIQSLSTTFHDTLPKHRSASVQSLANPSTISVCQIFDILSLRSSEDSISESIVVKSILALGSPEGQTMMQQKHADWLVWLAKNDDLVVGKKRLGTYFEPRIRKRDGARKYAASLTAVYASPIWAGATILGQNGRSWEEWREDIDGYFDKIGDADVRTLDSVITRFEYILKFNFKLFTTINGAIGMAPGNCCEGDKVYSLRGCSMPIILRKSNNVWKVIGEAYFHKHLPASEKEERLCLV